MGVDLNINVGEIIGYIMGGLVVIVCIFFITKCTIEEKGFGDNNMLSDCMNKCANIFEYDSDEKPCVDRCFNFFEKHPELLEREEFEKEYNFTTLDWLLE